MLRALARGKRGCDSPVHFAPQQRILASTFQVSCGTLPGCRNSYRRDRHMSLQMHLSELERRHQALEREIQDAIAHPSTDDLKIAELKRRKLQLKDEIVRLRAGNRVVH
jgi:hypothetical protein